MGAQIAWFNSVLRVMEVVMNICIHAHLNTCIYTCQGWAKPRKVQEWP